MWESGIPLLSLVYAAGSFCATGPFLSIVCSLFGRHLLCDSTRPLLSCIWLSFSEFLPHFFLPRFNWVSRRGLPGSSGADACLRHREIRIQTMRLTIPILPIANPKVMENYSHITPPTNRNSIIMRNRQSCRSRSTQQRLPLSTTKMQPQALFLDRLPMRSFMAFHHRPCCSRHTTTLTLTIPIRKWSHDTWQFSIPRQPSRCPLHSSSSSVVRSGLTRRLNQTIPAEEKSGRILQVSGSKDRQKPPKRPRCCSPHSPSKRRAMASTRKPPWNYHHHNNSNTITTTAYRPKR